jgi:hypothetical protein
VEVIIGLKFEVDEEKIKPRLGNRHGGRVEVALENCVIEAINQIFDKHSDITLTHTNVETTEDEW